VEREYFGTTPNGAPVYLLRLESASGVRAEVIEYGASAVSITLAEPNGQGDSVIVGYTELAAFLAGHLPLGATLRRYTGRISDAAFTIDDSQHVVSTTPADRHHEHGDDSGLHRADWWGEALNEGVRFHSRSPDGDQGFPGAVDCTVEYRLDEHGTLRIEYGATSDTPTIVDLSSQLYFNLSRGMQSGVMDHDLWIAAEEIVERDGDGAATGHLIGTANTPFDVRSPSRVGDQFFNSSNRSPDFVLNTSDKAPCTVAGLRDPKSGRNIEIATNQPCLLLTHAALESTTASVAFCVSLQNFPDAPNQAHFPNVIVDADNPYSKTTAFRFDWNRDFQATRGSAG
jgi:aldose 1-epimerase